MGKMDKKTTTLGQIFKGHERALSMCLIELEAGIDVNTLTRKHIDPILSDLEANAGQPMDSRYIAYMCQYAIHEASTTINQ